MHQVYLGLGTNLGDKEANLKAAIEEIRKRVGRLLPYPLFTLQNRGDLNRKTHSSMRFVVLFRIFLQ